ncbi:hypothetical protein MRB53_037863 [Persea americana]|nr:hypothetical protein MRB53_037863 [Persea americana]
MTAIHELVCTASAIHSGLVTGHAAMANRARHRPFLTTADERSFARKIATDALKLPVHWSEYASRYVPTRMRFGVSERATSACKRKMMKGTMNLPTSANCGKLETDNGISAFPTIMSDQRNNVASAMQDKVGSTSKMLVTRRHDLMTSD